MNSSSFIWNLHHPEKFPYADICWDSPRVYPATRPLTVKRSRPHSRRSALTWWTRLDHPPTLRLRGLETKIRPEKGWLLVNVLCFIISGLVWLIGGAKNMVAFNSLYYLSIFWPNYWNILKKGSTYWEIWIKLLSSFLTNLHYKLNSKHLCYHIEVSVLWIN